MCSARQHKPIGLSTFCNFRVGKEEVPSNGIGAGDTKYANFCAAMQIDKLTGPPTLPLLVLIYGVRAHLSVIMIDARRNRNLCEAHPTFSEADCGVRPDTHSRMVLWR